MIDKINFMDIWIIILIGRRKVKIYDIGILSMGISFLVFMNCRIFFLYGLVYISCFNLSLINLILVIKVVIIKCFIRGVSLGLLIIFKWSRVFLLCWMIFFGGFLGGLL